MICLNKQCVNISDLLGDLLLMISPVEYLGSNRNQLPQNWVLFLPFCLSSCSCVCRSAEAIYYLPACGYNGMFAVEVNARYTVQFELFPVSSSDGSLSDWHTALLKDEELTVVQFAVLWSEEGNLPFY